MKLLPSNISLLLGPILLLLALIYSQVAWRNDRKVYADLADRFATVRRQRTFPSDGENLAGSELRVVRGADNIPLAQIVRGRRAIIYFERADCAPCIWFAAKMDSILPAWRDSIIVVSVHDKKRGVASKLMLDSASTSIITGTPAMLVVDSIGDVRQSVPAGLPQVTKVLDFVGIPSPSGILHRDADSIRKAVKTAGATDD